MRSVAFTLLLSCLAAACGGGNNNKPSSTTQTNGCIAIVGNKGSITATISGSPSYSGTIPNGNTAYVPATANTPAAFTINAVALSNGTQLLIGGPARVGTVTSAFNIAPADTGTNYVRVSVQEVLANCAGAAGYWYADSFTGTATLTITSASSTGVAGTFTATVAASGGGATGTKTVSGSFTATF